MSTYQVKRLLNHIPDHHYRLLFEFIPHPYLIFLPNAPLFTIVAINEAYLATNILNSDSLGQGVLEAFQNKHSIFKENVKDLQTSLEKVLKEGVENKMQVQNKEKIKYFIPIHTPIVDEKGELIYILQRLEETSQTHLQNIPHLGKIAEELRTPLALILGPLQEIISSHYNQNTIEKNIHIAFRNAQQMLTCVNHLSDDFNKENFEKDQAELITSTTKTNQNIIQIFKQKNTIWKTIDNKQVTILFADDNTDMQKFVSELLKPYCKLIIVPDGEVAFEVASITPPDLILSEMNMPKMDGISLLKKCKSHKLLKAIPFVLISNKLNTQSKVESLQLAANDYLIKPFDPKELVERIKINLHLQLQEVLYKTEKELEKTKLDYLKLTEASRVKAEFMSIVAHELRTPITSIKGSLALFLKGFAKDMPESKHHLIDIAFNNCERLVLLINDILDAEKMEAGQMHFDMQRINLKKLILQATELNQSYCEKEGIFFDIQTPLYEGEVYVDANRLIQVLTNLISNATKFSPKNGKIKIETIELEKHVRTAISDNGPGIPEEFRDKIFEKFSQAHDPVNQQKKGTGLGLNICKIIIEKFGGQIGYSSKINQGTTFYFDLPKKNQS